MGIVVTIAMLIGLCQFLIKPVSIFVVAPSDQQKTRWFSGSFLLLIGLWNSLWYGSQHLDVFWGQAALISGIVMVASALVILMSLRSRSVVVERRWFHWVLILVLAVSFSLYAITIVQLNLGLDIIR